MKSILPKFAFGLVAILLVAAILLSLGQRESEAHPSATSYNPSGFHAFSDLLERNGIRTEVTRLEKPKLAKRDLVIAAYIEKETLIFGAKELVAIESSLKKFMIGGGSVLVLPFDQDFRAKSFAAFKAPTPIQSLRNDETLQVTTSPTSHGSLAMYEDRAYSVTANFLGIDSQDSTYTPWLKNGLNSNEPFIAIASKGQGILARTADGLFATNRFLDRHDNAEFALRTIRGLLKPGGKVVFTEATLGNGVAPSLASTLGPWASGITTQLSILFIVIIFTFGVRFGLPEVERRKQGGQREMIDAVSDVYLRAKSTAVALDVAYQEADRRIRRSLKMSAHIGNEERDRVLPDSLKGVLSQVDYVRKPYVQVNKRGKQKVIYRMSPKEAIALLQKLESELDAFVPKGRNRLS